MDKEQREAQAALTRKTSGQLFQEKMFGKENLNRLAAQMEKRLQGGMKKLINKQIDGNSWMNKLIQFYQEEMGSDDDSDESNSDASSNSSSRSSASASERSKSSAGSLGSVSGRSQSEERKTSSLMDADGNRAH